MKRLDQTFFRISLFLAVIMAVQNVKGQEIKLRTQLDKDTIWIGDQFEMTVSAELPIGASVVFPQIPDSLGKIEVIKRSVIDTSKIDAVRFKLQQTFVITSFDSGPHFVAPFSFKIESNMLRDTLKTNAVNFFVKVPDVDLARGPADIKKPFAAPVTFKEIAPLILGIILAAALIFLVIYYISRRKKNKPFFERAEKPRLPAHVVALQELDKLKNEKLWEHDKVKDYYTRLTDIVRNYIEERFGIPAMEQTTFDILTSFKEKKSMIDNKSFHDLKEILDIADLVKFAKLTPFADDNIRTLADAYEFIELTKVEEHIEPQKAVTDKNEKAVADINETKGGASHE